MYSHKNSHNFVLSQGYLPNPIIRPTQIWPYSFPGTYTCSSSMGPVTSSFFFSTVPIHLNTIISISKLTYSIPVHHSLTLYPLHQTLSLYQELASSPPGFSFISLCSSPKLTHCIHEQPPVIRGTGTLTSVLDAE